MSTLAPVPQRGLSTDQLDLLDLLLAEEGGEGESGRSRAIPRRPEGQEAPLSFAQQRMWFLHQFEPGSPAYNLPYVLRLEGRLDLPAFTRAFDEVRRRHEVLRTTFEVVRGQPRLKTAPPERQPVPVVDLERLPAGARNEQAYRLAVREARRPFDLEAGPLLRTLLLRLAGDRHVLLMTMHHVVSDAWSRGVLLREVTDLYRAFTAGEPAGLPELPIQYADFAAWQRSRQEHELAEQLAYWRRQLAGLPVLQLPTDRPRPAVRSSQGRRIFFRLSPAAGPALGEVSRRQGATLFMTLFAAFSALLGRISGQEDVPVGTPTANRNRRELEGLIGYFVNTLVLRADLGGNPPFDDLLRRVRQTALEAYAHEDLPFDLLVDELQPERDLSHTPLFQVVFSLERGTAGALRLPELTVSPAEVEDGTAKFDLTLILGEQDGWLGGALEYRTDLFDPATLLRLLEGLRTLLDGIAAGPAARLSDLPLLTPAARAQLLTEWNPGAVEPRPALGLDHLFSLRAQASPWAVALSCEGEQLTYGELERRSNQLARHLRGLGVEPGGRVGLFLERCLDAVVAIVGILKAGAAYVPVDPSYPAERVTFILEDSAASVLLTHRSLAPRLAATGARRVFLDEDREEILGLDGGPPSSRAPVCSPAYVIYTSGSTGTPKGVVVTHDNVVRLFETTQERFGFSERDVWSLFHSLAFDFSVWELWGALLYGGRLVIVPYLVSRSPEDFRACLIAERVTVLNQTPSAFAQLVAAESATAEPGDFALRWVVFGGEALDPARLRPWFARHGSRRPTLVNMYGITETTVHVTWRWIGEADTEGAAPSVIGESLPDLRIRLLDRHLQPVPIGVPGEICVGGGGASLGYLGRPELTAQRFIPDPFCDRPGQRLYRSGDLARYLPNGDLEYLGRIDHQVKIRGFRIELGEIETALLRHPAILQAVVIAREEAQGPRLVAYVVPRPGEPFSEGGLREFLREWLPEHMLPSATVQLEALPLTPNGKLDRRALPAPGPARPRLAEGYVAPRTPVEEILAAIWAEVLGVDRVGVDDGFFSLGGDSIRSVQVLALAREKGLDLSLPQLFQHQTIRSLAPQVGSGPAADAPPASEPFSLVPPADRQRLPAGVEDAYPLTRMQAGMLFHLELSSGTAEYHNVNSYHLRGRFDPAALQEAIDRVVALHPVLRTGFDLSRFSEPLQLVYRDARAVLRVEDIRQVPAADQEALIDAFVREESERLFDIERPPLIRFHIHLRSDDSYQFTFTENHVIVDGWSLHAVLRDIFHVYFLRLRGEEPEDEVPLSTSFRDFVAQERRELQSSESRRYWASRLEDRPGFALPAWPRAGSAEATEPDKRLIAARLSLELTAGLQEAARALSVPLKSVLLTAYLQTLRFESGQEDVVVGWVTHGRPETRDGERVRGLFVNTLPFRMRVAADSWRRLAGEVFDRERELLPFRGFPTAELQQAFGGGRPLFEVLFNFVHFHNIGDVLQSGEMVALGNRKRELSNLPLAVNFHLSPHVASILIDIEHDAHRYPGAQIQRFKERLLRALAGLAADLDAPPEAALLSAAERHQLRLEWNDTRSPLAGRCLHQGVEEQAGRFPGAVAVVFGEEELTREDLEARSNRLAHHLRSLGVSPGTPVGLCLERSLDLVVAVLGVLKAGGAYVPLDPAYPAERLAWMLEDSGAPVLLTCEPFRHVLPETAARVVCLDSAASGIAAASARTPGFLADPDFPAYVIYTSGSTGRPKGVVVSHRAIGNRLSWMLGRFPFSGGDRVLLKTSLSFDASIWELFLPLLAGMRLVVAPPEAHRDGPALSEVIRRHGVTVLQLVPSALRVFLPDLASCESLRWVFAGGESLPWDLQEKLFGSLGAELHHLYGPTEASIDTTWWPCRSGGAPSVPIGRPIDNARVHALDSGLQPVPAGAPGELYIGGAGLADGYLGRPDLTAERFIPDPFGDAAGGRLYRTGDLGRHLPDGSLEHLGRLDQQVKVRGVRIELPEIEAVLSGHALVAECAVVVREAAPGDPRLTAFVVGREENPSAGPLRAHLQARLPEALVPSSFVFLPALPRTPNGKLDRRALPVPELARAACPDTEWLAPSTPVQELLAGIWSELLLVERIGLRDGFFDLGGHSLLATQMISRLRRTLGVELPLRSLFDDPTLGGLAATVERALREGSPSTPPIEPAPRQGRLPLSHAQQRLWFIDQLEPGGTTYTMPSLVRFEGDLDVAALGAAFQEIVRRHEVLRSRFVVDEGEPAVVFSPPAPLQLPILDLSALPEPLRRAEAERRVRGELDRPFDLAAGLLFRLSLLRLAGRDFLLMALMHHIVGDGWSIEILGRELAALYQAFTARREARLPELPIQYVDFVAWQRRWLQGEVLGAHLDWWRDKLAGMPAVVELPADRPRPAVLSDRGASRTVLLPPALTEGLKALSREAGATLFMTLLAVFDVLLYRSTGQGDFGVGTPVAGRNRIEIEGLIGLFVNTLVMRVRCDGRESFRSLLEQARQMALGAYQHQDLPFEKLVEELSPERSLSHTPLFQVMFLLQNAPRQPLGLSEGLRMSGHGTATSRAMFDLSLTMQEIGAGLRCSLEYRTDLFDPASILRLLGHLRSLLEAITAAAETALEDLPLLTPPERAQLAREWNDTRRGADDGRCAHELIAAQARRSPGRVAVVQDGRGLTYGELDRRADRLARALRRRGIGPEARVALLMESCPEVIVALLSVLKAGGAYLPLDPAIPQERLLFVLKDSGASLVLTQGALAEIAGISGLPLLRLDREEPADLGEGEGGEPVSGAAPENLAYIIYTSGSTGLPKGVMIPHRALAVYARNTAEEHGLVPEDRVLQFASISFDASVEEIFPCLLRGATLVLRTPSMLDSPLTFLARCRDWGVTVVPLPTSYWHELAAALEDEPEAELPPAVRMVIMGGEQAQVERLRAWSRRRPEGVRLLNGYGPTEATVDTTRCFLDGPVDRLTVVPIGRPIPDVRVHCLDGALRPVPAGVAGELWIAGAGLARGYLGRPGLTAGRFLPDPFSEGPGERLYRTGDRARLLPDGRIELLGRLDHQVKIRGFRIELGEIETALGQHPEVRQVLVIAREDRPGQRVLAAYVVPAEGRQLSTRELRDFLRRKLPPYMVPSSFVVLGELPVTPAGKVDQRALPAPAEAREWRPVAAPRDPVEELLAAVWSEVLGVGEPGVHDDFFELGGHSLLASQIVARQRRAFGIELPLRDLFESPTIAGQAARVRAALASGGAVTAPPIERVPRDRELPLSFAQQRLWFLDQLEPGRAVYNMPVGLRIRGGLDVRTVTAVFHEIVRRHEVLRTTFAEVEGRAAQRIAPPASSPRPAPVVDLSGLPALRREEIARGLAREEATRPFDLARGPLMRLSLLRVAPADHVLLLTLHHVACDGWSTDILAREVSELYPAFAAGRPSPLPDLPIQYADYAVWQRRWLSGEVLTAHLDYWRRRLSGAPPLELPADRPRPRVPSYRGDLLESSLEGLAENLGALGRRFGGTLFMTLLAGWATVLGRVTGQDDLSLGSPIAARTRIETEDLIGMFANTLVLRLDLSGSPTFEDLLARVRETALEAYRYQELPFERLVEELEPDRSLSRPPLFQAMFVFQSALRRGAPVGDLEASSFDEHSRTAKFDLVLAMSERGERLATSLEYSTELFDPPTVRRLMGHFAEILRGIVADPGAPLGALPLLGPAERWQLVGEWNDTRTGRRPPLVHRAFEAQAERMPEAPAVRWNGTDLSYAELDRRASLLAGRLRALGVGPDVVVGICCERSFDMPVAVLGTLKAGGAYLPLDPAYPAERTRLMLGDAGAAVVLTQERLRPRLPATSAAVLCLDHQEEGSAAEEGRTGDPGLDPENLAYLIFTSGSTGRPKGVAMRHGALSNLIAWQLARSPAGAGARTLQFASLSFDVSFQELFSTWCAGGVLVLVDEETRRDFQRLLALIDEERVERIFLPYIALQHLAEAAADREPAGASLREIVTAGEQLQITPAIARLLARLPGGTLDNQYGPSESHVVTAWALAGPGAGPALPPIGRPIDEVEVHLLAPSFEPVPVGVPGELFLGGAALARGYIGRPDLTAERFVPDPWGPRPGGRLYRTGDLARRRPDGEIDFLGRMDGQVKIRGFRIEPGEVEAALALHPGVREAVVLAPEGPAGGRRLVAYLVPAPGGAPGVDEIRGFLAARLPEHMIPAAFLTLEALPLTPSGKVDRRRLPQVAGVPATVGDGDPAAPRGPVEELLAQIWAEVLGVERVGIHDGFFALGGHSLLATQAISRIRRTLGVDLPLRDLFEAPTVAGMAERIAASTREEAAALAPLVPAAREGRLPLSFAQQRLWFLDRLEPGSTAYTLPYVLRLEGSLDVSALDASLREIVRRHETLRSRFLVDEVGPAVAIDPPPAGVLACQDLAGLPERARLAEAEKQVREELERPFDLAAGPLLRARLLRLGEREHRLILVLHHAVSDGWSMQLFGRELAVLYRAFASGRPSPLPELPVQYVDFAVWQRRWLQGEALETQLDYWRRQLADAPAVLDLPSDRPRPAVLSDRGDARAVLLPPALARELTALGRRAGVTLFMTLLAAFDILLYRWTGEDDLAVGTPVAGRNRVEVEGLIGLFVQTLVLRARLRGEESFRSALEGVKRTSLEAHQHQDLPFDRLVEDLAPGRSLAHTPLFQVMFVLQNVPRRTSSLSEGLRASGEGAGTSAASFDLTLAAEEQDAGLVCSLAYRTDLFDAATILRLLERLRTLLESALEAPDTPLADLPLLPAAERAQVVREWNDTRRTPAPPSVPELFERQVVERPGAVAVIQDGVLVTYGELGRRARGIAAFLRERGVGPDIRVAIRIERCPEMIAALLGVLLAGGAYVPLDPDYPEERLEFLRSDSGAVLTLTRESLAAIGAGDTGSLPAVEPGQLAYVIYTSGSTGTPKGVMVDHQALATFAVNTGEAHGLGPGDRVFQFSSSSFDASVEEIFPALIRGAALVLRTPEMLTSPVHFLERCGELGVTVLPLATAYWHELTLALDERPDAALPEPVRQVIIGGERARVDRFASWTRRFGERVRLFNTYGPTEGTVDATRCTLDPAQAGLAALPIGRPVPGGRVHLLDATFRPVPIGAPGELHIAGAGVARGYLGRPGLTAERFLPDPFAEEPGGRLYRTGDRARLLPDGQIEFLGRLDGQVKVRGFRIETGEIEAVLRQHPGVQEAAVVAREDAADQVRLIAYVVAREGVEASGLRSFLGDRLPAYMVPAVFVSLDRMPVTPGGKLDRRALPDPGRRTGARSVPPRDRLELELVRIWEDLLPGQAISVTDGFFEVGGHSLLAIRLIARIERLTGRLLAVRDLFQSPSVEALAERLRREEVSLGSGNLVPLHRSGGRPPLFLVHPGGGSAVAYVPLARALGPEQPVYAFQASGIDGDEPPRTRIEDMAARYEQEMRTVQAEGPYVLAGWSFGGLVAFEMAQRLRRSGEAVALLTLIDSWLPEPAGIENARRRDLSLLADFAQDLGLAPGDVLPPGEARDLSLGEILAAILERAKDARLIARDVPLETMFRRFEVLRANERAALAYAPAPYGGETLFVRAGDLPDGRADDPLAAWRPLLSGGLAVTEVPGGHYGMVKEPHVQRLAEELARAIERTARAGGR